MRPWEISNWDKGAKIRRKAWSEDGFVRFINHHWTVFGGADASNDTLATMMTRDDWEPYEEPKQKKKVKLYRPLLLECGVIVSGAQWCSEKGRWTAPSEVVVGWEEREVEVSE